MNFFLKPPSLEQRALVKMAVSLWNQNDIGVLISLVYNEDRPFLSFTDGGWKEIEAGVLERVAQLPLPQPLKGKVSWVIQTVGFEIYKWIHFYYEHFDLPLNLPLELCWTPEGTLDRKRTAEALVRDESLAIDTRYKLACLYCLENDIMALWNTLSEDLKQSFLSENIPNTAEWGEKWIITFWSRIVKRKSLDNAQASYKGELVRCARKGYKAAVEYFLQKLTPRERGESLVEAAKDVHDADVLCLLLSEMEEEQQMEVFKHDRYRVLNCFLEWPFQIFFMEIANCMWDFLPQEDYEDILTTITDKVREGYKDCNYHKLFREFWQKSPSSLKSSITNDLDQSPLLSFLFHIKGKEFIQFILQDATLTVKQKLIYSEKVHSFCQNCIYEHEWDYLEIFIRECSPSKDLMLKFKKEFEYRKKWDDIEDILVRNKDKWDKLFLSSDDSLHEYKKSSADEDESSSSKRFHSLQ